jgi:hypothetical protein
LAIADWDCRLPIGIVDCRLTAAGGGLRYSDAMSAINGDKSRSQINRKRAVLRREKIRKLVAERKAGKGAASPATKPK